LLGRYARLPLVDFRQQAINTSPTQLDTLFFVRPQNLEFSEFFVGQDNSNGLPAMFNYQRRAQF
jgi:hypothetical protein